MCATYVVLNWIRWSYLLNSGGKSCRSSGDAEPTERRMGGRSGDRAVPKYSLESFGSSLGRMSTPVVIDVSSYV